VDQQRLAIVRRPGADMGAGLTTANLGWPDYALALRQHAAYVQALEHAGLRVIVLDPLPNFPDAHFVEDVAVVTPEVAVITRPGARERRGEEDVMATVLAAHRPIARIEGAGTLEGGDVLMMGRQVFVGISSRTNRDGASQLEAILTPHGYRIVTIPLPGGLHLKSSVNAAWDDTVIVTSALAGHDAFTGYRRVVIDSGDEYSANVLLVNDTVLVPTGFPRTVARLEAIGAPVVELDVSEMAKMDGGVTCLSVRL
jgi:dimethylargininase